MESAGETRLVAAERLFLESVESFYAGIPGARSHRRDASLITVSGLRHPDWNCAFVCNASQPQQLDDIDAELRGTRLPYSLRISEATAMDCCERAAERGLQEEARFGLMLLPHLESAAPTLGALRLERVTTVSQRELYTDLIAASFGTPLRLMRRVMRGQPLGDPRTPRWLGMLAETAVATIGLTLMEGTAWVVDVSTVPHHRGLGYGASMVRYALADAARSGATQAGLASLPKAAPLYARLGFEPLSQFRVYTPPR